MGLDTVRLKSPYMPKQLVDFVAMKGETYSRTVNATGETPWEITRTSLRGSFDSRIMVRPMYEDYPIGGNGGKKPQLKPSPPYIIVECSLPKAFYGQNVYGVVEDFQAACQHFAKLLETLLEVKLPDVLQWRVQRIDWAENFQLPYQAVQEYFEGISHVAFPRRKVNKYGNQSIFVAGTTTTVKLYHKGPEFEKNDRKRLFSVLLNEYRLIKPRNKTQTWVYQHANQHLAALQRLANNRLRAEVEIHAEKFDFDFGKKPLVKEITTPYLQAVFDKEMARLLREGQAMNDVIRTHIEVRDRLNRLCSTELAGILYSFWHDLATLGEDKTKSESNAKATFYRRRKQLVDMGISWLATDKQLFERQGQTLPVDFSPVRANPRCCKTLVRERFQFDSRIGFFNPAASL
jgi:II/X family phage/plasmid replication protein